jgi:alkylation response protein AidB-like acyl-CoA dehydrogenase
VDIYASDDQRMLQDMTRRFLEERAPIGVFRRSIENESGFDRQVWRDGAELGWTAIFVPEEFGGIAEHGQGVRDASIIAEEQGRVMYSGPFLPVSVVSFAIATAGTDAQRQAILPGLVAGETIAAWCFASKDSGIEAGDLRVAADGADYVISGQSSYVEEAEIADLLLVTAKDGEALSQFVLPADTSGVTIEPLDCLDLGRRIAVVRFDQVRVGSSALLGTQGGAADAFERQLQIALILRSSETVGVTQRALEFTLDWCNQRIAFGRPIGSFQALKHRLADHASQLEGSKAAVSHAARAVHGDASDAAPAASIAKAQSGRFGTIAIRDFLQLHGGIGMTWEHDIHFYLRRAVSNEALWGAPSEHFERLSRLAGLGEIKS